MSKKGRTLLPPDPLPALPDPMYAGKPGPYSASKLRDVTGSRIWPWALAWYKDRELLTGRGSAISCAHPDLDGWLADLRGFDPQGKINQPPLDEWEFHGVMARFSVWGEKLPYEVAPGTFVIDYNNLASRPGEPPTKPWVMNLRERFPEGSKLILAFFNDRDMTWGLWPMGHTFWSHPFLDQFDGILLPDFSCFSDDPVPQSLLGERTQQIFGAEGSRYGRNVIPTIAWRSEDSLRRQLEFWVSQYPHVNTIHIDAYGADVIRNLWVWRWLMAMERYCKNWPHIRWIVSGITTGGGIRHMNEEIFPDRNYHVMTPVTFSADAMKGSRDPKFWAEAFQGSLKKVEDLYLGNVVADKLVRPDHWPTFAEAWKGEKPWEVVDGADAGEDVV